MAWISAELGNKYYGAQCSPDDVEVPDEPYPWVDPKQPILAQLAALDLKVPRGLEDLISSQQIDVTTLPIVTQGMLAQKATLRSQL